MSDIRVCKFCDRQFDIDNLSSSVRVIDTDESHFTFIDNGGYGACHVMLKAAQSAERIEPAEGVEYEVRVPDRVAIVAEEIVEAEQPTAVEEILAAHAESLAVEPEPETESASLAAEPDFKIDYGVEIDARIRDLPRRKDGYGFAVASHLPPSKSPSFVWFDEDIETMGTIYLGSLIRAIVTEPDAGYTLPRLRNIRIYQENQWQQ